MRGFTLVEVVISIGIIALVGVATATLLMRTDLYTKEIQFQEIGLRVAHNQLEILRAGGFDALPASGPFSNSLLTLLPAGAGTVAVTTVDTKTKQVVVTVSWRKPFSSAVTPGATLSTLVAQGSTLK
jgi:prepilin-type N-terminal cleavage/methylation domain-containing protein